MNFLMLGLSFIAKGGLDGLSVLCQTVIAQVVEVRIMKVKQCDTLCGRKCKGSKAIGKSVVAKIVRKVFLGFIHCYTLDLLILPIQNQIEISTEKWTGRLTEKSTVLDKVPRTKIETFAQKMQINI